MRQLIFGCAIAFLCAALPVDAAPPSAEAIVRQMKDAFEPVRPSTRTVTITTSDLGESLKLVARQARKQLPDGKRLVTVLLAPPDIRGTAILLSEEESHRQPATLWTYLPLVRRVRKVAPMDAYDHFLGTDYTLADLGFVHLNDRYQLISEEDHGSVKAYKLEETMSPENYYYSKIVTWVSQTSKLPLERDYYSPAKELWKKEIFDAAAVIDGVPTILHTKMTDVLSKTSTDMQISEVKYDTVIPDAIFNPEDLPKLAEDPLWSDGSGALH